MPHRVMLLLLTTGLFVALWNSDRQCVQSEIPRFSLDFAPQAVHSKSAIITIPFDDPWMCGGCTVPLPKKMAPGHFRVVDNFGRVQDVTLTVQELIYLGIEVDSEVIDLYTEIDGTRRWYFVRIDQPNDIDVNNDARRHLATSSNDPPKP